MEAKQLMKMSYFDPKAETRLEAYADTIVIEKEGSISYFAAVRLGGYPESVKGMSEPKSKNHHIRMSRLN